MADTTTSGSAPNAPSGVYTHSVAHSYAENIKHSRTNFLVLLLAQFYCLITIETTQDAALLSNATTQKLPILETTIGVETFYIIAPTILLIVFFHFQIHLKSFFTTMVQAARREGRDPVDLVDTYPWFITSSMTRRYAAGSHNETGFSSWFEYVAGLIFGWYSTAIVCFMFWARYLPVHDWNVTIFHSALTALAVAGSVFFLYASKSGLRMQKLTGWRVLPRGFAVLLAFMAPFGGMMYASWWMFEAQDEAGCVPGSFDERCDALFLLKDKLKIAGIGSVAKLDGADISERPEGWVPPLEPTYQDLLPVRGATLAQADLRYASARDTLFIRADLSGAVIRRATFDGAALQGARMIGTDLSFSTFVAAKFDHARLSGVTMVSVDFSDASFRSAVFEGIEADKASDVLATGADFTQATLLSCQFPNADFRSSIWVQAKMDDCQFVGATFDRADMTSASLERAAFTDFTSLAEVKATNAVMTQAILVDAQASKADFSGADLFAAVLTRGQYVETLFEGAIMEQVQIEAALMRNAKMRGVSFFRARLVNVDLSRADLRETEFVRTQLSGVNFSGADLVGARFIQVDLSETVGLTQQQLDRACGEDAVLPQGLTLKPCGAL